MAVRVWPIVPQAARPPDTARSASLPASPVAAGLLRLGDGLRAHRGWIALAQVAVMGLYTVLLIVPAILPLPDDTARAWNHMTVLAQFAFWGVWWPFVLISMIALGRAWCGLLCPEGALTEFVSRWSLNRPIPRWMRWHGWPFAAFATTTVFGQLVSVYQYPKAALLVLGGSTVAAIGVGLVYVRGKRIWCRHLCPVNGVFGLLAKLAPMHFHADDTAWRQWTPAPGARLPAVNCAPLLPLRHLTSASACHACGRCSGHRNAIRLQTRSPNEEILHHGAASGQRWQSVLIVFGLIGLAQGAFLWSANPWLLSFKQLGAEWLVNHDWLWPLQDNAPWWLLTHYPQVNDSFTWLDGALIVSHIAAWCGLVGGLLWLALEAAAFVLLPARTAVLSAVRPTRAQVRDHLSQSLIPLAGAGLFLGLSALTVSLLRAEGVDLSRAVPLLRAVLLVGATSWSLYLAYRIIGLQAVSRQARYAATGLMALACAGSNVGWMLWFWGW